jgi:excisionase family DNA binding protein
MFNEYSDIVMVDDLCEMLTTGKNTAYTLLNTSNIKALHYGRVWRIPKQAVIDFIFESSRMGISSFHLIPRDRRFLLYN